MRIINKDIFCKVCEIFNVPKNNYKYYSSGKCSDLFLNEESKILLKINLWHIKTDTKQQVFDKMESKIKFIKYLEKNDYPIVGVKEMDSLSYIVVEHNKSLYVAYFMEYKEHNNEIVDSELVIPLIKRFHDLSKNYVIEEQVSNWLDDFYSIISICDDDILKNKFCEYKNIFEHMSYDSYGYIHFDLNQTNFIVSKNKIYMIDFDTMTIGWYLMDIANYVFNCYVISFKDNLFKSREELKKLYSDIDKYYDNKIDMKSLEIFLKYRKIFLYIILKKYIDHYDINVSNKIRTDILNDNIIN